MGGVQKVLRPPQSHQHKPARIETGLGKTRRIEFTCRSRMRAPQNGALGSGENEAREQGCRRAAKLVHPATQKPLTQNRVGLSGAKGEGLHAGC